MKDISNEARRHYHFLDGDKTSVENPKTLREVHLPHGDIHEITCIDGKTVTLYGPWRMITTIPHPTPDE